MVAFGRRYFPLKVGGAIWDSDFRGRFGEKQQRSAVLCFVGSRLPLVSYLINCLSYFLISHGYMIYKLLFITAVYDLLLRIDENMSM